MKKRTEQRIQDWLLAGRRRLEQGRFDDAEAYFDRVLAVTPDVNALHLKGISAMQRGQAAQAVGLFEAAIRHDNTNANYYCDLGTAYHALRDLVPSEAAYRRALDVDPKNETSAYNLANLLRERKRPLEALKLYSALLAQRPDHEHAWNNCGLTLLDLAKLDEARRCFAQALQLNPRNLDALLNQGFVCSQSGEILQAIELYQLGLTIDPSHSNLHLNLSNALLRAGRTEEAIASARRAIAAEPSNSVAHSALIFSLDYSLDVSTKDQQDARKNWYEHCIAPLGIRPLDQYRNPDAQRKLRIGYVSPDFRYSSAALGFSAVLLNHDRTHFEIYCYSSSLLEDGLTLQFHAHADAWRNVSGLTDVEAATLITKDSIDILVDLSAHMSGNRLGVFAYKPAPIQVSAWGYAGGTGMPEMDYLFADPVFLPVEERSLFREDVVDLPAVISYRPPEPLPDCAQPPILRLGHPTFGCFNRLYKISDFSIALWARLLERIPGSKLLLKSSQKVEESVLDAFRAKFETAGIDPERIGFLPHGQWRLHMESFGEVDVLLDPYPHGGGVSLIEAFLMGVPTLALRGDTAPSRLAPALLGSVGLGDWVADTPEALLNLGENKCADIIGLATLRAELRKRTLSSPLGDNLSYTRLVEQHYREFWRRCCPSLNASHARLLQQARDALMTGDAASALREIEPLIELNPNDAAALHLAGIASSLLADRTAAVELLERSVSLAPNNADSLVDLGTVLTSSRRRIDAIAAFERALALQPDHGIAHFNLGNVFLQLDRTDEAREHYERARDLLPQDPKVVNNLGIILERGGRTEDAESYYLEALRLAPEFAEGHENVGRILIEREDFSTGVERYERALALAPRLHHIRYELAVWYDKLGLHKRISQLCTLVPAMKEVPITADGGEDNVRRAFSAITALVITDLREQKTDSRDVENELMKFCGRLMELDHPGKIWLVEEVLRLNPDNLQAYTQLGVCHYHDCLFGEAHRAWIAHISHRDESARKQRLDQLPLRVLDASWYLAVGHIAMLDSYIKAMQLGWHPEHRLWLLRVPSQKIPNQAYLDCWQAYLNVPEPGPTGSNRDEISRNTGVPGTSLQYITDFFWANKDAEGRVLCHQQFATAVQREWEAQGRPPLLCLREGDQRQGEEALALLGLPAGAWFVCFHVREQGFWWKWNRIHGTTRDADILTYTPAMRAVVERGGWVIRMGDATMKKLPSIPGVVDYAHSALRSEKMDVFLSARCRFFVGVNSGLSLLPATFGRPCVLTNFVPISVPLPYTIDIIVPKLLRKRAEDRFLTFEELFETGLADVQFVKCMPEDVEVVDNQPDELREAVLEMLDELEGGLTAGELPEVQELRGRYDSMVLRHGGFLGSRLSGSFLLRYRDLLEPVRR